jgi:phosphoglucomutase/phosphomannomutase
MQVAANSAEVLAAVRDAGTLSPEALRNLELWLTDPSLAEFTPAIQALVEQHNWEELEDAFYQHVPLGTGGIRGRIGVGPNRINVRTIGEAAQALCQFIAVRGDAAKQRGVVIGHEARRNSREFAAMCCEVFAANGVRALRFEGVRATPEISFAVRHLATTAGVQITASHNPRTDNGFKFYWSDGGQVVPPLDAEFMTLVQDVRAIDRMPFADGVAAGLIQTIDPSVDDAYIHAVESLSIEPTRSARIVFGATHGAGKTNVLPVLRAAGYEVEPVPEQLEPNEDFPTAAGDLINPEYREVVALPLKYAEQSGADLAIASDPDADRAGIIAPIDFTSRTYQLLRGDDVGAALTHYILDRRAARGLIGPNDLVLETFVTSSLTGDIARSFGVECVDDLLVGFKWMAQIIQQREEAGRLGFVFATEESIGYLADNIVRDKDAAMGALYAAELASWLKDRGKTMWDYMDDLYAKYGCYRNLQQVVELPGKTGMQVMREVMLGLRSRPLSNLGGKDVVRVLDRLPDERRPREVYALGSGTDMVTFVLSDDARSRVTVRPSGTEPKLKYYIQLYEPVSAAGVDEQKARLSELALSVANEVVDRSGDSIGAGLPADEAARLTAEWRVGVRRIV